MWDEPARDVVAITPQSSVPTSRSPVYRSILVDTAGTYEVATVNRYGAWTSMYLPAGVSPIQFVAVHTGAVAGNVWGLV